VPVVRHGLVELAHLEADAALPMGVAELLGQPHGLAERGVGLGVVARLEAYPADGLAGERLALRVGG
jgi:hypothetical protein